MSQLEQKLDSKLGITDTNQVGQWSQVESAMDAKLGIEPKPEPTFEEKEKHIKDVMNLSDELDLPYRRVIDEYDEIQRQKKEFPFGELRQGSNEFSARKMFRNLYDKVKPPPLGEASPGQIYDKLTEGVKGTGRIGVEYLVGKKTLGLADMLAEPMSALKDVYLANKKLKKDFESKGLTVTDVGSKFDPAWRITDKDGNVEFISPNTVANKELSSSIAELYDRIVGLEVSPTEKKWGEIAKSIGMFKGAAKLRGPMPRSVGALGKAGHAFQVGTIYGTANELSNGISGDESYRGAIGVMEDGAVLAALSLMGSGVGGIWKKLKPTEQRKALKLLGLKDGATEKQIKSAARKAFLRYHPDKVAGMRAEFDKTLRARDILLNPDYGKDIIYRGSAPSPIKLLMGLTPEGDPILSAKPMIKVEPKPVLITPTVAPKATEAPQGVTEGKKILFHGGPVKKGELPTIEKSDPTDIRGVFFTEDAETAKSYGEREGREGIVQEFEVDIKKPATGEIAEQIEAELRAEGVKEPHLFQMVTDELLDRGFDSVIRESGTGDEFIILKDDVISPTPAQGVTEKLPLSDKDFDKFSKGMRPGFVDIEPYVDALKSAHDWTFTFGETKRLNPELFDKLMESYGKRNASVEKAISILKRSTVASLTEEEAMQLAITYEDKRLTPPEGLEETFNGYKNLLDKISELTVKEGILKQTFQERMIAENEAKISTLRDRNPSSKKIAELVAENEELKQIRYLPHNIVAQRAIEAKLAELKGEERKVYLGSITRISAKFKKRGGKLFMKDYLDAGILKPGDIDIRNLTAHALTDYYYKSALKNLFDYATESELIKPSSTELRKLGWQNQQEIGITSPELTDKVVHPLLASSLAEMKEMKLGKGGGTLRQILSMVKIGQFIKPSVIWTYNSIQSFMKGIYLIDPIKGQQLMAKSFRSVIGKNALYHKLNESNLYQFPYEVSKGSIEEQIEQYIRQNSPEVFRLTKLLEKTTDMTWKAEDLDLKKMIMVGHKALANLTWLGDKVQRTHSYLILRQMGYPHDEAVKVAANSHGAYSALSEKFKKTLSPITFVYSFRVLMPIEIAKILTEPLIGIPSAFIKGESIPKYKWNRWVKSWIGAVAVPLLTDMYMKKRGFEKEGKHLGPLAWKWKKTVMLDGKEREIVVGVNNILNMPVKYWNRITYYNPIKPEARWQQSMNNLIKWEIHPLWRIFFWDIRENRKSFGSGVNIYNPNDSTSKQLGQTFLYVFGQSFRFWGGMMDAVGEGNMIERER